MAERYVYGVVAAGLGLPRVKGIGERTIARVEAGEVAAVLGDVEPPVRAGRQELAAHARVLQKVMERGAVLPMRFGMVLPDAEAVRSELLEPFHDDLLEQLRELAGTVELHLRGTYEESSLMREVLGGDSRISGLSRRLRGQPADATYYAQIELGQRVAEAVEQAAERDRAEIIAELEGLSVALSVGEARDERVACDLAFLVEAERLPEFDRAVDELGRRQDGRMRFAYTGPHPPYNFVELPAQV